MGRIKRKTERSEERNTVRKWEANAGVEKDK